MPPPSWAAWLVVAAFVLQVYGSAISSSSATPAGVTRGTMLQTTETLVEVNGAGAALEMAVPLVATLVVAIAVLGALAIGIFMLPATAALVVACVLASRTAPAAGT